MEILQDIILYTNLFYHTGSRSFKDKIPADVSYDLIEEPVIVMDTLHSCYSHALLDSCFPIYWVIDDLVKTGRIPDRNIRIFIRKENIVRYPRQNLAIIDSDANTYKGVFRSIIEILTLHPILFEHALNRNYVFKTCIMFPMDGDRWQRTPWNCVDYYPDRNIPKHEVRFTDTVIYDKLMQFRTSVFTKLGIDVSSSATNNLLIIDRKKDRKIDPRTLQHLTAAAEKNTSWSFTGVAVLEDMTFEEQVKLFASTRIFIMRHGSSEINLLWIPDNSIVFELEKGAEGLSGPMMYKRICKLTNSQHTVLDYTTFDAQKDIFDKLSSDIK